MQYSTRHSHHETQNSRFCVILDAIFHSTKTNVSQATSLLQTQQSASATNCFIAIGVIAMATKTAKTIKAAKLPQLPQLQQHYNNHCIQHNPFFWPAIEQFEKERGGRVVNYTTINKSTRKGLHHEQHAKKVAMTYQDGCHLREYFV
eukprot:234616-Ditylum_brightwellii.AAC.1